MNGKLQYSSVHGHASIFSFLRFFSFCAYSMCNAMYENFPWLSIELYFYRLAAMLSLLTSSLITARHVGLLTIASVSDSISDEK